jgi:hypothetical protein
MQPPAALTCRHALAQDGRLSMVGCFEFDLVEAG